MSIIGNLLERADRIWLQNPWTIVEFVGRLLRAFPITLADVSSARWKSTLKAFGASFTKSVFRSLLPVVGVVAVAVWGVGEISRSLGPLTRPTFQANVLPLLLGTILPIVLATVITARQGATLVAKYLAGVGAWILHAPESPNGLAELQREVMPRLAGGILASIIFYLLLCWGLLVGYLGQGSLTEISEIPIGTVVGFVDQHGLRSSIHHGAARCAASAAMIVLIASALGMRDGRRAKEQPNCEDCYDAAWESSMMSLLCSFLIAFLP